jgi:dihydrodipicolinate synthase/N-acetylneuraminate lyase
MAPFDWRARLWEGVVIPAHPLALTASRRLDERRQRALTRYYLDAGSGGIAVGVHTTQFAIRERGLYQPVLSLAAEEARNRDVVRIAGVCGTRSQALWEARCAALLGYDPALLSLGALAGASVEELIDHARAVGEVLPLVGFYLQPAVGGRVLEAEFWRRFAALESVVAIKIAPFNRYHTLDVLRGMAESGRAAEIALYTGNDDHIVLDLIASYRGLRMVGGLLGQWAVWTRRAVEMLEAIHRDPGAPTWNEVAWQLTDANAALFDAAHDFRGSIAGVHEILRRQGLLEGIWCLDARETLSPGQLAEIDRVCAAYPELADDDFCRTESRPLVSVANPMTAVEAAPAHGAGVSSTNDEKSAAIIAGSRVSSTRSGVCATWRFGPTASAMPSRLGITPPGSSDVNFPLPSKLARTQEKAKPSCLSPLKVTDRVDALLTDRLAFAFVTICEMAGTSTLKSVLLDFSTLMLKSRLVMAESRM